MITKQKLEDAKFDAVDILDAAWSVALDNGYISRTTPAGDELEIEEKKIVIAIAQLISSRLK